MENMQEDEINPGMIWDKPFYYFEDQLFVPRIYTGSLRNTELPDGFNTVIIRLEGGLKADLEWKQARIDAQKFTEKGYMILWEINLGLFSQLPFALSNQTQYLSLSLSLEYFRDSLWKEFKESSLGLIIGRSNADFSQFFPLEDQHIDNLRIWLQDVFMNEQAFENEIGMKTCSFQEITPQFLLKSKAGHRLLSLFCRNIAIEYLNLLSNRLPDTLPRYVLLDANSLAEDPLLQAQIFNPEVFDSLNYILLGATIPTQTIGWGSESPYGFMNNVNLTSSKQEESVKIGICLPSSDLYPSRYYIGLREALQHLINDKIPFRLIPESLLITHWDDLDYILYVPEGLSHQGKRKLQGFCAAGGTVVTLGDIQGLVNEIELKEMLLGRQLS